MRMPSEIMDHRRFCMPPAPTSFFSEEFHLPAERQVGFRKSESVPDHHETDGMSLMLASKSVSSSSFGRILSGGVHSVEHVEFSQPGIFENHKTKFSQENHSMRTENSSGLSMASWRTDEYLGPRSGSYALPASQFLGGDKVDMSSSHKNSYFASSLTDIFDKKLILSSRGSFGQSIDTVDSNFTGDQSMEEIEAQTIGDLLPDDNDLLSGLIEDLECNARLNSRDDVDDDLFYSGGGIELEFDDNLNCKKAPDFFTEKSYNCQRGVLNGSFGGEQPYDEHLSRTLIVRNINSNIEDAELRVLFEQYGDIQTLYTACKHRGFIMISYYDLRAARNAMKALQNMPLRHQKLDIHFSIPKVNLSEKGINQGTVVVFNNDSSVSNDDLHQLFGVYGEIKEIRETPQNRHQKFIEFYDVRAADVAHRALKRTDIAGNKIKVEPGLSSSARWRSMQQLSLELEQEDSVGRVQGSPFNDSPSGCFGSFPLGGITSSGLDTGASQGLPSAVQVSPRPFMETACHGMASRIPHSLSSPVMVTSVGNYNNQSSRREPSHSLGHLNMGFNSMPFQPQSFPEFHDGMTNGISYNIPNTMSAMGLNSRPAEGIDFRHTQRVGSAVANGHSFEENALGVMGSGSCPLHGHQYVVNNCNSYHHHPHSPMIFSSSPSFLNNIPEHPHPQMHGLARSPSHTLNNLPPLHRHRVGSAPAVNPSLWDRRHVYAADSVEAPCFHPGSLGSVQLTGSSQLHSLELASPNIFSPAGNCFSPSLFSPHGGIPSPQQRPPLLPNDRIRSRKGDASANQADNKKQYELDIERIVRGEDSRTTLMIKNIPNKYTSKMLLATIDDHHRGTYNFIYLPIDFKNKCNVGYAFINMIDAAQIIPFYQAFHGKKWEKFNSEKVASLAYARIQGKAALIAHFQNSSLMNEDKRCRPILFHTDGPNAGDQEPFPVGPNIRFRPGRSRTNSNEEIIQDSPPSSANGEESSNETCSSSSSTKDSE